MKKRNQLLKYNLQYFADDNGNADQDGADNSGDGDDDQDDDQDDDDTDDKSKKSGKKGKFYSQEEIDEIITKRLERERKKQERRQRSKEDKKDDEDPDKSSEKLTALEEKVLCYDHDIAKEYVKEAIALAKAYVDEDTDMDEALEKVTKKFPQFVKGYDSKKKDSDDEDEDDTNKKSWGQRQKGSTKKIDPVEARFLEKNPGLKID
jgi:hypothetical protein